MTAAQTAEFTKLRTLQKLLRYYEEQHGQVEGIHHLRLHVIEQMRRLAKLMRYGAAAAVVLLLIGPALAKDDGRYRNTDPGIKAWINGLKDKNGNGCCDTSDGYPAEVEWDTERENYRVRIEGVWYVVQPDAVLTEPNKLGYPMVWYWRKDGVPQIRCFIPGAGG